MDEYFKTLLDTYHKELTMYSTSKKNKGELVAITLVLSEYYYNHNEMLKARHHLEDLLVLDSTIEKVHLYLALIDLYENKHSSAIEHLEKELKLNPNNSYAKELYDKVSLSTTFPFISLVLILLFLGSTFFASYPLSIVSMLSYGVSLQNFSFANLISSLFIHSSYIHLFSNIILLLLLGQLVEKHLGHFKFLLLFLVTGLFGNFSQLMLSNSENLIVVGASAGLYGMLGVLLMRTPLLDLRLFGFIKMPLVLLLGFLFALSVFNPFTSIQSAEIAHLSGFFLGMLFSAVLFPQNTPIFYHWIFISLGFLGLFYSTYYIFFSQLHIIFILFILLLSSLAFIVYGYTSLKQYFTLRGERE